MNSPTRPILPPGILVEHSSVGHCGWNIFYLSIRLPLRRPFDTKEEAVEAVWRYVTSDEGRRTAGMDWVEFADAETARANTATKCSDQLAAMAREAIARCREAVELCNISQDMADDLAEVATSLQDRVDDLVLIDVVAAELRVKKDQS